MIQSTDAERHQAVIAGLRELADYLEARPDLPVNLSPTISYSVSSYINDDAAARAEVDRIARVLDVEPESPDADSGYYKASRWFGPIQYKAVAISRQRMAQYQAECSYRGLVQPEEARA